MTGHEKNVALSLLHGVPVDLDPTLVEPQWLARWLHTSRALVASGRPVHAAALYEAGDPPVPLDGPCPAPDVVDDSVAALEESGVERRVRAAARNPARGYSYVDSVIQASQAPSRTRGKQFADVIQAEMARLKEGKTRARHISTGLPALDDILGGGFPRGVVSVLGARPGVGKSSFSLGASCAANSSGSGVHVVSLEDPAWRYVYRFVGRATGIPVSLVPSVAPAVPLPARWIVDDTPGHTARSICRAVRQEAGRNGTNFIVVDYAQLLRGDHPGEAEHLKLASAMAEFVGLARTLDAVVLVVSQINRNASGPGQRATMGDLKSSGSLEEVAKVVLLLHRPGVGDVEDRVLEVDVVKNNFGRAGETVSLNWDGATCRIW